jgi:hypothetical protein
MSEYCLDGSKISEMFCPILMDTGDVSCYEAKMLKYIYLSELFNFKGAVFMKSGMNTVYSPKINEINDEYKYYCF